jgi:cytochrome b6-f complex iron-sulfur subunit
METSTVLLIAIPALVVLAAAFLLATASRRDRSAAIGQLSRETLERDRGVVAPADEPRVTGRDVERAAVLQRQGESSALVLAPPAPPATYVPPDPETLGITRRQFFNRSIVALFGAGLSGFGAACLAFLWPSLSGGFGSKVTVGALDDVLGEIRDAREPKYVAEARTYIAPFPEDAVDQARNVYTGGVLSGMEAGVVALYQKCVHLGCKVPFCKTSQWFECPCHGSQYNRVGEKKGGPAPRGLDRFAVDVSGGILRVDTAVIVEGPVIGVNTTGQEAEGPHCISGAGGH